MWLLRSPRGVLQEDGTLKLVLNEAPQKQSLACPQQRATPWRAKLGLHHTICIRDRDGVPKAALRQGHGHCLCLGGHWMP